MAYGVFLVIKAPLFILNFKVMSTEDRIIQMLSSPDDQLVMLGAIMLNNISSQEEQTAIFLRDAEKDPNFITPNKKRIVRRRYITQEERHDELIKYRNFTNIKGRFWTMYMTYSFVFMTPTYFKNKMECKTITL